MARPTTTTKVTGTTIPGNGSTGPIPMDYRDGTTCTSIQLVVSGSGTFSVQYTCDPVNDINQNDINNGGYAAMFNETTANWFNLNGLTAVTASAVSNIAFPVTAVRVICTVNGGGNAFARILQAPVAA